MLTLVKYTSAPEPPNASTFYEQVAETVSTSTYSGATNYASYTGAATGSDVSTFARHVFASSTTQSTTAGGSTFTESVSHVETRISQGGSVHGASGPLYGTQQQLWETYVGGATTISKTLSRSSYGATIGTRFSLATSMTYATASTTRSERTETVQWETTVSDLSASPVSGTVTSSGTFWAGYGTATTFRTEEMTTARTVGAVVHTFIGGSVFLCTLQQSRKVTAVGVAVLGSTRSFSNSWTAAIPRDETTTSTTSQSIGSFAVTTDATTTQATNSGTATTSTTAAPFTRHTTVTGLLTYSAVTTTTSRAWDASSNLPFSWSSRSVEVVIVFGTDYVLALRSSGWDQVQAGTYDRRELPLGLIDAGAQLLVTDGDQYSQHGATTGSYFAYATVTVTRTAVVDTTFVRATPGGVLPVDQVETVTAASRLDSVTFTTYGSDATPTYTYSGIDYRDLRDSHAGFTSVSTSNAALWNSGGSARWGVAYTGSSSASPLRWFYSGSYEYETQSVSGQTTDTVRTYRTAGTSAQRAFYASTGVSGEDYSVTTTSRYSADLNSWWTYTYIEDDVSERNMLIVANPCEVGLVPYPGMSAGSNLSILPPDYPPALASSIYGSISRGGVLSPAFFGSSAVGSYSTSYNGGNTYRYSAESPATTGVAELFAIGDATPLTSVAPFVGYSSDAPPTVVGGNGDETTVSMFLQRYSWYSFMALAYSSMKLSDSEAAVTFGTWNCVPWMEASSATTMRVAADAQVVFRFVPNVVTFTSKEIGETTAVPTNSMLNWATTATYDPWV